MIKRVMSIVMIVALFLAQAGIATAFVSDGTQVVTASADLSTGAPVATLVVNFFNVSDDAAAAGLGWSGVNLGDGWTVSDQYIEVAYDANQIGWGVQIYTDNTDAGATPQYSGDPANNLSQQPAGLIGAQNTLITCPMALLVYDDIIPSASIQIPNEVETGTPGTAGYGIHFDTGYDEVVGGDSEYTWFWLKDLASTMWDDVNSDDIVDPGEVVSNFSATGDDYATIVSTYGSSSGWVEDPSGIMQRDSDANSPIYVYAAADFSNANELQVYSTSTLTLEIYHE